MAADLTRSIDALSRMVEILGPLTSEERNRLIQAAFALLGENFTFSERVIDVGPAAPDHLSDLAPRTQAWMKQNSISPFELEQVFHISEGVSEFIAARLPGKNKKEQTHVAYIVTGIGQLVATGSASFDDKLARALCENVGCYDSANHSAYLRDRGNEFTGSKEKGWSLTAPGLRRGADIIKDICKLNG